MARPRSRAGRAHHLSRRMEARHEVAGGVNPGGGGPRWPGADLPGRRLFIAVPLPDAAAAQVAELVDRVRAEGAPGGGRDVRWVRLDGLHITLRFLGPTLDERVDPAAEAMKLAAHGRSSFDVAIRGAG